MTFEPPVPAPLPAPEVAVVTGAAAGVGAASARALRAAGMKVALLDVDVDRARAVAASLSDGDGDGDGDGAVAYRCDVSDEDEVASVFAAVRERFGRLDVLHSNAGIFLGHGTGNDGPLETLDLDTWRRVLDVNLTGTYLVCKHAMPMLLERGGSIVVTASVSGVYLASAAHAYAASKAGVVGLVRSLVFTYAARGVRVNAICPGVVRTDMSVQTRTRPEQLERLVQAVPAGRIAEPEEIAAVVAFLASPAASYLNGAVLPMEGGLVVA